MSSPASGKTLQANGPADRNSVGPDFLTRSLHVAVLIVFAVSLPILDLIGRQADFLLAHRAGRFEIVALTVVLYFLLPAVAVVGMKLCESVLRLRRIPYVFAVAASVVLISLPMLKKTGYSSSWGILMVAGCLGAVSAFCLRFDWFRSFLMLLLPIFVISPAHFIFLSSASKLLSEEDHSNYVAHVGNPVPVVLMIFDEFSLPDLLNKDLNIDADLYPNFAALANSSYWYKNGTTVAPTTNYAVPAILTGRYPDQAMPRLPTYKDYPDSLFSMLKNQYSIYSLEPYTGMCPTSVCQGESGLATRLRRTMAILSDLRLVYLHVILPDTLTVGLPTISNVWRNFGPSSWHKDRVTKAMEFLEGVSGNVTSSMPPAILLHNIIPHVPWEYLPSGKTYGGDNRVTLFNPGIENRGVWGNDKWLVDECYQRYLLQIRYTDRLLGQFFDVLKRKGIYDQALLIVVADHGVSFQPGNPRRKINQRTLHEIAAVPFFIKLPFQKQGVVVQKSVETIDILPTIASVLDIDSLPGTLPGQSIIDTEFEERPRKVLFKTAQRVGESLDFDSMSKEELTEIVTRRIRLFGAGVDPEGIYARGPCPELVGLPVRDLMAEELEVWLHSSESYENIDVEKNSIPARVFGRVQEMDDQRPRLLAVAVNGVVRAMARLFTYGKNPDSFSAMIPESALVVGTNRVQVYDVSICLPPESSVIFSNGFESGVLENWANSMKDIK